MKIIKAGKSPNAAILKGTCQDCECKVECEKREAKWLDEDRPGAGDGCYTVDCPTAGCGRLIYLSEKGGSK